jgi:hypothetical protein
MTWSVYQHWDPLKVCVVGRSYPPEFYSWITVPHVRSLFEKIAIETEEDYQNIIKKLQEFGVEVLRPDIPNDPELLMNIEGQWAPPPMTPRDYTIMIGDTFYDTTSGKIISMYNEIRQPGWPDCNSWKDWHCLPADIRKICTEQYNINTRYHTPEGAYDHILDCIRAKGNQVIRNSNRHINGAMVSRIGRDLYFASYKNDQNTTYQQSITDSFTNTRNHFVFTDGHGDGTYCPVCPGLIISLKDVPTYADTFPGWEVVYLPYQSWSRVEDFLNLKSKNAGKWWIPGFERDQAVIDVVESWLGHWTGYVEETVFDVNMLIIDPKNVIVFNYNKQVFDALDRYGITPHVVPFRHRYFWDGGIHCVTSDLHREGTMQDFFPNRNNNV